MDNTLKEQIVQEMFIRKLITSRVESDVHIDVKGLLAHHDLLNDFIAEISRIIEEKDLEFDVIAGTPTVSLALASAYGMDHGHPIILNRHEPDLFKVAGHTVEGTFSRYQTALIISDIMVDGSKKAMNVNFFREAGLDVKDIITLFDKSIEPVVSKDYTIHSIISLSDMISQE